MNSLSEKLHSYVSKGDLQNAYLTAEREYKKNPENLEIITIYIDIILRVNHKPLLEKALRIIKSIKDDIYKYPNLSHLLSNIYMQLGDSDALKKHRKNCLDAIGWKDVDGNSLENIEDISSANSDDLSFDQKYYNIQLKELVEYLLDSHFNDSKELKKIYNLLDNNYNDDAFYLLKIFAQNLKDKNIAQFVLAELALSDQKFDIAEKWFNKILDKIDNKGMIYNRLGDIAFEKGQNTKALTYYSKSYEHNPEDENTNLDLIRSHIMNNNLNEAKKVYINATDKFGRNKTASLKGFISKAVVNNNSYFINGLVVCINQDGEEIDGMVNQISFKSKESSDSNVIISGNLSFMTIESIKIAENLMYEYCEEDINKSITVFWSHSITMSDGDSAGLGITIGLIGIATNRKIPKTIAFTGAINHDGTVKRIGGLNRKLISAYIHGIKTVYIPKQNYPDLFSVDAEIKSKLIIKQVNHYKDVVGDIWN